MGLVGVLVVFGVLVAGACGFVGFAAVLAGWSGLLSVGCWCDCLWFAFVVYVLICAVWLHWFDVLSVIAV